MLQAESCVFVEVKREDSLCENTRLDDDFGYLIDLFVADYVRQRDQSLCLELVRHTFFKLTIAISF